MRPTEPVQLIVETVDEAVRVIRFHGPLNRSGAARLLRLVDAQLDVDAAGRGRLTDVIVDLGGVSSFEPGGPQVLRHARTSARARGVGFHLTGLASRFYLMPLHARQVAGEFSMFPNLELALAVLSPESDEASRREAAPRPGTPSGTRS